MKRKKRTGKHIQSYLPIDWVKLLYHYSTEKGVPVRQVIQAAVVEALKNCDIKWIERKANELFAKQGATYAEWKKCKDKDKGIV
jgi:hypothetical protein